MARLKNKGIRLVIPNGSLYENTAILLKRAKYHFNFSERGFEASVSENCIIKQLFKCRPMDIPGMIMDGDVDAGITGKDWYLEWCYENGFGDNKLKIATELAYTKNSNKPMDIIVLCKKGSSVDPTVIKRKIRKGKKVVGFVEKFGIVDKKGINVKAEYPNIGRRFFKESRITFSHGSSEANLLVSRKHHYCIVGRDSGLTLKENDKLKVVIILLQSPVVLLARKITKDILKLSSQLKSAYIAESLRTLDFNVANDEVKKKVFKVLDDTGYKSANIIPFADGIGSSIRVGVKENDLEDLTNKLLDADADYLIVSKPEQVFMK